MDGSMDRWMDEWMCEGADAQMTGPEGSLENVWVATAYVHLLNHTQVKQTHLIAKCLSGKCVFQWVYWCLMSKHSFHTSCPLRSKSSSKVFENFEFSVLIWFKKKKSRLLHLSRYRSLNSTPLFCSWRTNIEKACLDAIHRVKSL